MKSPSSMDTLVFIIGLASLALRAQCSDIALYGGLLDTADLYPNENSFGDENDAFDDSLTIKLGKAACPPDSVPYYARKLPKPCSTKQSRTCPLKGYTCHEDSVVNVSICCGKMEGCRQGQPLINNQTNRAIVCYLTGKGNITNQCQPPYLCQEKRPGSKVGFCCPPIPESTPAPVRAEAQKLPSVTGCPSGTKVMKQPGGGPIRCDIDRPSSCPGSAKCYLDSLDNTSKCCAADHDDACPSGFKTVKANGIDVTCSVEVNTRKHQPCPQNAFCHRSASTNSYRCCEADHGCPDGKSPVIEPSGIRNCSNGGQCPEGSTCDYSSWKKQSQCCTTATGAPPVSSGRCPEGYLSTEDVKGMNIPMPDFGSCDSSKPNGCNPPAICMRAVDAPQSQHLCCLPSPQCLQSKQSAYLEHDKPKLCSRAPLQSECPVGYGCEESTLPSVHICCSSVARMPQIPGTGPVPPAGVLAPSVTPIPPPITEDLRCPAKFEVQKEGAVACDPQQTASCNAGSKCLPANKPGYFVCCVPISPISSATCTPDGVYIWRHTEGPRTCNPNFIFTGCPQTHPLCLFYPPIGRHSCCRAPICPNGNEPFWTLGTTIPRHCGNVESGECPAGYLCLFSPLFDANICCLSRFRMRNTIGSGGHLSPTYNGGMQEQRRTFASSPWNQFDNDMRWPNVK